MLFRSEATGAEPEQARAALASTDGDAKAAIVVLLAGVEPEAARRHLDASGGRVRAALERAGE